LLGHALLLVARTKWFDASLSIRRPRRNCRGTCELRKQTGQTAQPEDRQVGSGVEALWNGFTVHRHPTGETTGCSWSAEIAALMEADDQRTCSGKKHRLETEETVAMSAGILCIATRPAACAQRIKS
jgi:hypothetical protein